MKKFKAFVLIYIFMFLVSCDSNFVSSLSGTIYELDGVTPFPDVQVFVYNNEEDRDNDYLGFQEDMKNIMDRQYDRKNCDENGNFRPSNNISVARAKSDNNGKFTVSRIMWSSKSPTYGKDGDIHNVYLLYFSKFAGNNNSTNVAFKYGLIADLNPISIVSGGLNNDSVKAQIRRKYLMLDYGFSGFIRKSNIPSISLGSEGGGFAFYDNGSSTDDGIPLELYYMDNSTYQKKEWKSVATDMKRQSGIVKTSHVESSLGDSGYVFSVDHGNFVLLGAGSVYELIYDEGSNQGYVWFYIKDRDTNKALGVDNIYTSAFRLYSSTVAVDSIINMYRNVDLFVEEPEPN